jgi:hypothetical protein
MLPLKVVREVRRLLDEGRHSQRQIAETVGVSRGTVQAIAAGKRGIYGAEPTGDAEPSNVPPVRCPGCGARVYLPCVLCKARAYRAHRELAKSLQAANPKRVA